MIIKIGNEYGTRKVVRLVATRGKIRHFKIECTACGHICIMSELSLHRNRSCHKCRLTKAGRKFNSMFFKSRGIK